MPDPTSRIRFISVFSKKAWIILRKTDLGLIWMAWSGFGQTHLVWKQAVAGAGNIGPGFWQDATGPLPVSHFQTRFRSSTDVPDNTVEQNQPGSDLVLAGCVRFWPNGSDLEASRCTRVFRPAAGQCFPVDPDRMRIGSGMFTGSVFVSNISNSSLCQLYDVLHV